MSRGTGHRLAAVAVALAAGLAVGPAFMARAGIAQAPGSYPPPTPVPPDGSPSPYPTSLATPPPTDAPPSLRAASAILVDLDAGQVLFALRPGRPRPIASLTKIMTALLVLERTEDGERISASPTAAAQSGSELGLRPGETLPVGDLLHALMLQSANDAAVALAEHVSGTVDGFVAEMNVRAAALGLDRTRFFSPNGLDDRGFSTAADLARLTREALRMPELAEVASAKFHDVPARSGPPRHIQNRNALLWLYAGTTGVKTGFTTAAGYCLIATAERDGERLLAVVLGEPVQAWDETAELLNYGFTAFDHEEVLSPGAAVDPVEVDGVSVPAVAGGSVRAYVHDARPRVSVTVSVRPGLTFPLGEGDPLGEAVVRVGGTEVGRVFVVVGELPPTPGEGRPLWLRVVHVLVAMLGDVAREAAAEAA